MANIKSINKFLCVGDGYTCYPHTEVTGTTQGPPIPKCNSDGMCWCPPGWQFMDNDCVRPRNNENEPTTTHGAHNDRKKNIKSYYSNRTINKKGKKKFVCLIIAC